jgi:hypothetical protein
MDITMTASGKPTTSRPALPKPIVARVQLHNRVTTNLQLAASTLEIDLRPRVLLLQLSLASLVLVLIVVSRWLLVRRLFYYKYINK